MPGLESLLDALKFLFDVNTKPKAKPVPPVLTASAIQDQGLDEVQSALEKLIEGQAESGLLKEKKFARLEVEIKAAIQGELWEKFKTAAGPDADVRAAAQRLDEDGSSPYPFIRDLGRRISLRISTEGAHGEPRT
ncbi:MAG: hypothetical protein FJY80_05310 [Candidatus Aminicenantes bacterium]|nr:hypothetical protein [Candidatus Aminicenantes bacterium]